MYNYPLLLTATINPSKDKSLHLADPEKRHKQYIETLLKFVFESNFTHFVFCENSTYDLKHIKYIKNIAESIGKYIEILQFLGDAKKTEMYTSAYGDQEIMEYAVSKSKFIAWAGWFYKITWRYRIENINEILYARSNKKTVFVKWWLFKKTAHTAFFKCSVPYFITHFEWKSNQLKKFGNSLEYLYYYYIAQSGIKMSIHWVHPYFSAEWGSGGRIDQSWFMKLKTKIFAYFWIYDIN